MKISTDTVADFFSANNIDPDLAPDLLEYLRADEVRRGQNTEDTRNIHEYLKELSTPDVKHRLDETRSGLVAAFYNVLGDFNLSSAVRNANWYNIEKVWFVGRKKWDRRGAVGTHNYIDVNHSPEMLPLIEQYRALGYTIAAAEVSKDAVPLTTYNWQDKTFLIFGEEGAGVPKEILDVVDDVVIIPARGSVRSLNVATAAGTFMYDYSLKAGYLD